MKETHENSFAMYLLTDELLHIIYKRVPCIDLKAAQRVVQDRMDLQKGKEMPVLCDIRAVRMIDKPARDYLALEGFPLDQGIGLFDRPPDHRYDQFLLFGDPCTKSADPGLYQKIGSLGLFGH